MIGQRKPRARESFDRVLIAGQTQDGEGLNALRARPGRLDLAEIRPVTQGQHLGGSEMVKLSPTSSSLVWDVDVQFDGVQAAEPGEQQEAPARKGKGPTRVASNSYRRNWDSIFSSPPAGNSGKDRGVN